MKKPRRFWARALLVAVLAAVYCNFSIDTEEWVIHSPRLPRPFDGVRIALLSDIHGGRFGPGSKTLLEAVEQSEPDYIAISGDLVDEFSDLSMLEPLLRGLTAIAPTFYVTGNHEWVREDTEEVISLIEEQGVTVFRNDYLTLEREGQTIVLAGVEDPNAYADTETPKVFMERLRDEVPGDPYTVVMYHRNNSIALWSGLEADVVLSGHGHGGVIRLPFVGGLLGVDRRPFPKDAEGLYTQGRTTLAVSRGLGGVRLFNRPHLPTIVLRR